jgi:hypothetical protein
VPYRLIVLGALLAAAVLAEAAPVVYSAHRERAARREMAALELGLRAAQQGHALAVA